MVSPFTVPAEGTGVAVGGAGVTVNVGVGLGRFPIPIPPEEQDANRSIKNQKSGQRNDFKADILSIIPDVS